MEMKTSPAPAPFVITAKPFLPFPGLVSETSETDPGAGTSHGGAPAPVAAKGKPGRKGKGKVSAPDIFLSDAAALDKARLGADPDDEEMQPTENV